MLELDFSGLVAVDLRSRNRPEVLTHVEGDLSVVDGQCELYSEVLFPVLELSIELNTWLAAAGGRRSNFHFKSMSFEELGVVRFVRVEDGWRVGSVLRPEVWSGTFQLKDVEAEVGRFIGEVRRECSALLGVWVLEYFE
ncbi:hypothetical protein [Amycolatopsis nigrescens]|uniref:DUF7878 domain-containing protein n=1 Tax=Amycolatopsis nigrescens TaxID=381445 RepID=UPI0012F99376|nr:hypothetical protein [Amycolatopsis nigrescens]